MKLDRKPTGLLDRAAQEGEWDGFITPRASESERFAADLAPLLEPVALVTGITTALLLVLPYGWEEPSEELRVAALDLVDPWTHTWLWLLLAFLLAWLLFQGLLTRISGDPAHGRGALLVWLACALLAPVAWWRQTNPWTLQVERRARTGERYALLTREVEHRRGRVEGPWAFLALEEPGWFHRSFTLLYRHDPAEDTRFTYMVRPRREVDDWGWQLHLVEPDVLVGMPAGNRATLFYSRLPIKYLLDPEPRPRSIDEANHRAVGELPPFLLIGEHDRPHGLDVAELSRLILHFAPSTPGYPRLERLEAATEHPVPGVRQAARELVKLRRARLPESAVPEDDPARSRAWDNPYAVREGEEEPEEESGGWRTVGTSWGQPEEEEEPGGEGAAQDPGEPGAAGDSSPPRARAP